MLQEWCCRSRSSWSVCLHWLLTALSCQRCCRPGGGACRLNGLFHRCETHLGLPVSRMASAVVRQTIARARHSLPELDAAWQLMQQHTRHGDTGRCSAMSGNAPTSGGVGASQALPHVTSDTTDVSFLSSGHMMCLCAAPSPPPPYPLPPGTPVRSPCTRPTRSAAQLLTVGCSTTWSLHGR